MTSYNALIEPGTFPAPVIDAVASDPAATVSVDGTRVTVTNGSASTVYTVNVNRVIRRGRVVGRAAGRRAPAGA